MSPFVMVKARGDTPVRLSSTNGVSATIQPGGSPILKKYLAYALNNGCELCDEVAEDEAETEAPKAEKKKRKRRTKKEIEQETAPDEALDQTLDQTTETNDVPETEVDATVEEELNNLIDFTKSAIEEGNIENFDNQNVIKLSILNDVAGRGISDQEHSYIWSKATS